MKKYVCMKICHSPDLLIQLKVYPAEMSMICFQFLMI